MSQEIFLGKTELDSIFAKQSVSDYVNNHEAIYYLSIPALLFYLESKRKGSSLNTEMKGFVQALESGFEHNIVPINLSIESIEDALADEDFINQNVSMHKNPFLLSAQTSLFYGNPWWSCDRLESFIEAFFS